MRIFISLGSHPDLYFTGFGFCGETQPSCDFLCVIHSWASFSDVHHHFVVFRKRFFCVDAKKTVKILEDILYIFPES